MRCAYPGYFATSNDLLQCVGIAEFFDLAAGFHEIGDVLLKALVGDGDGILGVVTGLDNGLAGLSFLCGHGGFLVGIVCLVYPGWCKNSFRVFFGSLD
jgi:hypothetical protein